MEGAWVGVQLGGTTIGVGLSSRLAAVARRNDGRVRGGRFRRDGRETEGARGDLRHGENGDAGLLDGAISRSGRKQAGPVTNGNLG